MGAREESPPRWAERSAWSKAVKSKRLLASQDTPQVGQDVAIVFLT